MKRFFLPALLIASLAAQGQGRMTPELLWSLKRVGADGLNNNGTAVYLSVRQVDWKTEKTSSKNYLLDIAGGKKTELSLPAGKSILQRDKAAWYAKDARSLYKSTDQGKNWQKIFDGLEDADNVKVSPDGRYVVFSKEVLVKPMMGTDLYPDLPKTTAQVYTDLNYRHWDTWEDGKFSHLFVADLSIGKARDIMPDQPYDCPQKPFGGAEDIVWNPDSKGLLYVCKKKFGKEYAQSTNTDLYYYNIGSGGTDNWTMGMEGYDTNPSFSPDGKYVAWLSMRRDGFESDKNRIMVMDAQGGADRPRREVTAGFDDAANSFVWDAGSRKIYFVAPYRGTEQLFEVGVPGNLMMRSIDVVTQVTGGKFDVNGIVGQSGDGKELIVTRCDMNHATELYAVNLEDGDMRALTHENDATYAGLTLSKTKLRKVKTSDGKEMGVWVIYPPGFDSTKKYPTLLYCQGGPQSALTQFYSFRWNFQLMAAQGYIVVAPNRRGMPGWGTQWNESISKDWGGQPMRDYLAAIDDVAKEPYVDRDRLGCIGASYGGYSVFMLAGMHGNRFRSFIAHDGLFDLKSWYGTTEELWFANWDIGSNYWQDNASKSYQDYNPSNFVARWNAPIMIVQGGTDYRVPIEQGLEAFQAAQLRGIKSKLLYFPNENHWVLHPQNGLAWQREFFKWLDETLK